MPNETFLLISDGYWRAKLSGLACQIDHQRMIPSKLQVIDLTKLKASKTFLEALRTQKWLNLSTIPKCFAEVYVMSLKAIYLTVSRLLQQQFNNKKSRRLAEHKKLFNFNCLFAVLDFDMRENAHKSFRLPFHSIWDFLEELFRRANECHCIIWK